MNNMTVSMPETAVFTWRTSKMMTVSPYFQELFSFSLVMVKSTYKTAFLSNVSYSLADL